MKLFKAYLLLSCFPILTNATTVCPPPETILRNGIFKYARGPEIWRLYSSKFEYQSQNWVITYITRGMSEVQDKAEALTLGDQLFKKAILETPQANREGVRLLCVYTKPYQSPTLIGDYWVGAETYITRD